MYFYIHDQMTGALIYVNAFEQKFNQWTQEVCDGLLDFPWHAGNENRPNYDV